MEKNSYKNKARFVGLVRNWHKASDGHGLSEAMSVQQRYAELYSRRLDAIAQGGQRLLSNGCE